MPTSYQTFLAESRTARERRSVVNEQRRLEADSNYHNALDIMACFSRKTNGKGGKRYNSREEFVEVRRIYNNARGIVRGRRVGWNRNDAVKRARRKGAEVYPPTEESRRIFRLARDPDADVITSSPSTRSG